MATLSPEASAEVAVGSEVMLESPELIIDEPMKSNVGVAMRGLLIAQSALQVSGREFKVQHNVLTINYRIVQYLLGNFDILSRPLTRTRKLVNFLWLLGESSFSEAPPLPPPLIPSCLLSECSVFFSRGQSSE